MIKLTHEYNYKYDHSYDFIKIILKFKIYRYGKFYVYI